MELSALTDDETLVLVGFMRVVARADGQFTEEEEQHVAIVERVLGPERFRQATLDARAKLGDLDALKAAAKEVTRQDARVMIYKVLTNLAASDEITREEEKPLRWLASWWRL